MKWKIHFLPSSRHQHNTLMGFNMIKRTLPGTMKNQANTDCWRACKNVGKEAERQAERNAVGQGNVNL